MALIQLIEDDQDIRELATRALAGAGHAVAASATGMAGLQDVIDRSPDIVVLDLGLPDIDGSELLRMLRSVSDVPVVIATARDDEAEIVRLFDAGADDYVVKPYSAAQLEARIRAVLRRSSSDDSRDTVEVAGLRIDRAGRSVTLDGVALETNRKEFDILVCLAERVGHVVTREELFAEVWREPYGGADKTIDVHMSWLRRKLGETAADPRYLHTVRGVGFKLVAPT